MPIEGTPAFNAVALIEIELSYASGQPNLVGHAAYVNTRSGKTYGRTTGRVWSRETMAALEALRASMEQDIASLMFEGGGVESPARTTGPRLPAAEPGGIGEDMQPDAQPL